MNARGYVDVVKIIVLKAGVSEERIEAEAARAVQREFGFSEAAYRVDVMQFDPKGKHELLTQRIIENGKLRRMH